MNTGDSDIFYYSINAKNMSFTKIIPYTVKRRIECCLLPKQISCRKLFCHNDLYRAYCFSKDFH